MPRKKLTPQQEKEIKLLQANNEMLLKTIEETKLRGNLETVERIETARKDVIAQMAAIDATEAKKASKQQIEESIVESMVSAHRQQETETIFDKLEKKTEVKPIEVVEEKVKPVETKSSYYSHTPTDFNNIDSNLQYDIISLPSNGECYRNKVSRVPVAYLTAADENMITSPNLYKDGLIIDFLLKHKIVNKDINVDELVSGDVDAIILWLRATSYGVDFPIIVKDPLSGEQIETTVDLTELKPKEFNLVGDENGLFDFTLPLSKDLVKFRFLTRKDERNLQLINELENNGVKALEVKQCVQKLNDIIKNETLVSGREKQVMINDLEKFKNLAKELEKQDSVAYSRTITNRLEMCVVSINGETDRKYIANYIQNMSARDSLMLRRYILENEPGIDFEITVQRPERLGGGEFKTFLELSDSLFLNIA